MNKDPYSILGVSRSAGEGEIKRAYRRLAKECHPDRNPGDKSAEQRFKEVQAAYEVLGDPQRRRDFDRFGAGGPAPEFHRWQHPDGRRGGGNVAVDFGDLSSIFEQFFQRGAGGGSRARPAAHPAADTNGSADIEVEAEFSFDEALHGTQREITLDHGGSAEQFSFRVPPGVRNGQRIRVRGRGHAGRRGRGNLIIRCRVRPHEYFRMEGRDVLVDLPLSIAEATLGAKVDVPTPAGSRRISVPPGTSSGTRLRLRGLGAAAAGDTAPGDLYVVVRVMVPRDPSERVRELITELAQADREDPRAGAAWSRGA